MPSTMYGRARQTSLRSPLSPRRNAQIGISSTKTGGGPAKAQQAYATSPFSLPVPAHKSHAPIPMPSDHIHRTKSELQLTEETKAAEWRDRAMFHRLVSGIRQRQELREQDQRQATGFAGHLPRTDKRIDSIVSGSEGTDHFLGTPTAPVTPYDSPPHHSRCDMTDDVPAMDLQDALLRASGIALDAKDSGWSLEGYDCPEVAPKERSEDENGNEDEGIFSLDL